MPGWQSPRAGNVLEWPQGRLEEPSRERPSGVRSPGSIGRWVAYEARTAPLPPCNHSAIRSRLPPFSLASPRRQASSATAPAALSPPFPAGRASWHGWEGAGRVPGSGTSAGKAQSPLRREGQHLQTSSFRSPLRVRLEGRAWKHKLEEFAGSPPFFVNLGLSGSSAEGARWAQGSVCSHAPPGVSWLLRGPGLRLVPLLDVMPARPPLSRLMRRSGGCVKWRGCLRGAVCRDRLLPPGAPVLGLNKNSPK
ncbi:uncharacterized protein LOC134417918 [Melospiza melodia melodia]|uniref:uncharacterized protein LOC134417918 n=1 Tax=Melospiza melodia melodia TaxID=1914991 RepID=UPI002FD67EC9